MLCVYDHEHPETQNQHAEDDEADAQTEPEDSATSSRPAGGSLTPVGFSSEGPRESKERRLVELRLMHQYSTRTARALLASHSSQGEHLWSIDCPRLAFEHEAVLYAILALTALHIAKADPIWPYPDAIDAHRKYLDLALPAHSNDMAHLTRENADSACVAASLLRICAFAYLSERPRDPYTLPLQWLRMSNGSGMVFHATWDWIQNDGAPLAHQLLEREPQLTPFNETLFLDSNRRGFEHLVEQRDPTESWSLDIEHAYKVAVSYIGSILIAIDAGEERNPISRRLMAFSLLVHPGFIKLVEEGQPRALVVLAHYFAVLAEFEDIWWIGSAGRREVLGIQTAIPTEWHEAMRWPLSHIEDGH